MKIDTETFKDTTLNEYLEENGSNDINFKTISFEEDGVLVTKNFTEIDGIAYKFKDEEIMSNKDKLIDTIRDRIKVMRRYEDDDSFVIIVGQKEWAEMNSIDSTVIPLKNNETFMRYKVKRVYVPSALDIISEDTFKAMMRINQDELVHGLSRLNTRFAYVD